MIDGKTYTSDVIIFPDRVFSPWWRRIGHSLCREDIAEILEEKPETLVIGTGSGGGMKVPFETAEAVRQKGIEMIVESTGAAVKTYNQLCQKRLTVGAFHLTC